MGLHSSLVVHSPLVRTFGLDLDFHPLDQATLSPLMEIHWLALGHPFAFHCLDVAAIEPDCSAAPM